MTPARLLAFISLALLLVAGCDTSSQAVGSTKTADAGNANLVAMRAEVDILKGQVDALRRHRDMEDLIREMDKIAYLTPGTDGYSTITFDLGVLTVQLSDVMAYANGSKVILRFGNIFATSVNGLKTTVEWGQVDVNGLANNETAKSKEVTFAEPLRAASWTSVPLVLEGIPPEKLGFVRIKDVKHTGIRLVK